MVDYVPIEKGQTVRQPSVANLMVDSTDRNYTAYPTAGDFQIIRPQSLMNGYFTRIGATEVVMDWGIPNITEANNEVNYTISGESLTTINLPVGFYNVAEALDAMAYEMSIASSRTFNISYTAGVPVFYLDVSGAALTTFFFGDSPLIGQLGFLYGSGNQATNHQVGGNLSSGYNGVDLRTYTYLDFVSGQLTYAQDVKDSATNNQDKNVLTRWYMAWDSPQPNDKYGFPILMGYQKFVCRRLFNPAKQIRWEPNLPIGNLGFEVWTKLVGQTTPASYFQLRNTIAPEYAGLFDWQMTLQVSEV